MLLRRIAPAVLALTGLAACEPEVSHSTNPQTVSFAAFDLSSNPPEIPLPNQLALLPTSIATQTGAQKELLTAFATAGGFPNDQEVPITIDFVRLDIDPNTEQFASLWRWT